MFPPPAVYSTKQTARESQYPQSLPGRTVNWRSAKAVAFALSLLRELEARRGISQETMNATETEKALPSTSAKKPQKATGISKSGRG